MRQPDPMEGVFRYQHRAMATLFELMIAGEEESFAGGAAVAAFDEIDRLEQDLSRFLPNSDISRINNLPPGGVTRVSPHTFECLRLSLLYHGETAGAFDVTVGALMDCWLARDGSLRTPSPEDIAAAAARKGMDRLELDEGTMSVSVRGVAPRIDLGAIGKGFAVDLAAGLLREWGVGSALVHGGTSSAYAFGDYPFSAGGWPVTLGDPFQAEGVLEKILLNNTGIGGSGVGRRSHILDPRTSRPVEKWRAAWVVSGSSARSDALSTACMALSREEIAALVSRSGDFRAVLVGETPEIVFRAGRPDAAPPDAAPPDAAPRPSA